MAAQIEEPRADFMSPQFGEHNINLDLLSTKDLAKGSSNEDSVTSTSEESELASSISSEHSSTIQITHKNSRTIGSALLQSAIRPFGPRLVKSPKPAPSGSPCLQAPDSVHKGCNVRNLQIEDIKLYEICARWGSTVALFQTKEGSGWHPGEAQARQASKEEPHVDTGSLYQTESLVGEDVRTRDWAQNYDGKSLRRPRYIYYFPGGGWQQPATDEHWKLCAHLATELTKRGTPTSVFLVSYPLAPANPASVTMAMLSKLYYYLFPPDPPCPSNPNGSCLPNDPSHKNPVPPEIIFAGDSAGANVALALTLHILSVDPSAKVPDSIMLMSPAVDMRNNSPELLQAAKKDPLLRKSFIDFTHKNWCGAIDPSDPLVTPIEGDLAVLAKRNIAVHGVIGTYDILSGDAQKLVEKLDKASVKGKWLVWEKQIHCFPLTFAHGLQDGKDGVTWMIDVLSNGK